MSPSRLRPAGFDARPQRPSSLRAKARKSYVVAAQNDEMLRPTLDPSPQEPAPGRAQARPGWGREQTACAANDGQGHADAPPQTRAVLTPLTQRARALYEDSVVPVHEIARLVGVSGRTLYRYVRKGGWRRRHARASGETGLPARDAAVAAANRGRPHAPGRRATAKGAGGRFIHRAEEGKPFARGLKALDPAGGAQALARCEWAAVLSAEALARARAFRVALCDARTLAILARVVRELAAFEDNSLRAPAAGVRRLQRTEAADEEALRGELARRIDALVQSWADAEPDDGPALGQGRRG